MLLQRYLGTNIDVELFENCRCHKCEWIVDFICFILESRRLWLETAVLWSTWLKLTTRVKDWDPVLDPGPKLLTGIFMWSKRIRPTKMDITTVQWTIPLICYWHVWLRCTVMGATNYMLILSKLLSCSLKLLNLPWLPWKEDLPPSMRWWLATTLLKCRFLDSFEIISLVCWILNYFPRFFGIYWDIFRVSSRFSMYFFSSRGGAGRRGRFFNARKIIDDSW